GLGEGHEVLGLDLVAVARGELEAEVRQALEPWPGLARVGRERGRIAARERRARVEATTAHPVAGQLRLVRVETALHPRLLERRLVPLGEDGHRVPRGEDRAR